MINKTIEEGLRSEEENDSYLGTLKKVIYHNGKSIKIKAKQKVTAIPGTETLKKEIL